MPSEKKTREHDTKGKSVTLFHPLHCYRK